MFKPINFGDISPNVNCYNEMDYIQTINSIEVYDNPELGLKIARYNKYSFLIRSGILVEAIKYMQTINPNYAITKCPSYTKYGMLLSTIGNAHTYGNLYDDITEELGSPEDAFETLNFYKQLVYAYDVGKYYLINNETIDIVGKILAKVVNPILADIETNIKLPYFSASFNNFMEYSLGLYSVGQYIVDKEFKTIGQYWKTLRLELYNALYAIDERVVKEYDDINDSLINIQSTFENLPEIQITEIEVAKDYLAAFNYLSDAFERHYHGVIGRINEFYHQLKGTTCSYDDREVYHHSCGSGSDPRSSLEIFKVLLNHLNETHGIVSEIYRQVCSIDEISKDNVILAEPFTTNVKQYSLLFNVVSNLTVYLPILRLTISLLYARVKLQDSGVK